MSFVPELFGGNASEKQLTKFSGIMDHFNVVDAMMAGGGFPIEELTKPHGIQIYMPDFIVEGDQIRPC